MTIDIAYFLYIFGHIGANMLKSRAMNKICPHLPNLFSHIKGGWGICTPDPKI